MGSDLNRGLSKTVLATVLAMAGMVTATGSAKAADPIAPMDSQTAEQILRVLVPADQQFSLDKIFQANSMNDLTPTEQDQLLQALKSAAKNLTNSMKPVF